MQGVDEESGCSLLALWEAKRGDRPMPVRADFDVVRDLRPFLGNLILAESVDCGRDWRFRVFGSTIACYIGEERQGKRVSELPLEEGEVLRAQFDQVAAARTPLLRSFPVTSRHRAQRCNALLLPLADDGEKVNMVLLLVITGRPLRTRVM